MVIKSVKDIPTIIGSIGCFRPGGMIVCQHYERGIGGRPSGDYVKSAKLADKVVAKIQYQLARVSKKSGLKITRQERGKVVIQLLG